MNTTDYTRLETKDYAQEAMGHTAQLKHQPQAVPAQPADTDQLNTIYAQFTEVNDAVLSELEHKSGADVLLEEKLARLDAAIDAQMQRLTELQLKSQRPAKAASSPAAQQADGVEHKTAFDSYMRKGQEQHLKALEQKAMSGGSTTEGGYLLPQQLEADILRRISSLSPIRAIAANRKVSGPSYRRPMIAANPAVDWASETEARTETDAMVLRMREVKIFELSAMPAVTQTLLDDAAVDLSQILAEEVEGAFAEKESEAFISGNGTSAPQGLLSVTVHNTLEDTGTSIGSIKTGVNDAFASTNGADVLLSLIYGVKTGVRRNGRFLFNRRTQSELRKLKDGQGNYLWQPPVSAGADPSLMGFPVTEAEHMPDMTATNPYAIAFGDFQRAYMVVDRVGISVLRDPYSSKPNVLLYITKRVGGGVMDYDAVKFINFSA